MTDTNELHAVTQADRDAADNAVLAAAADIANGNVGGAEWLAELFAAHRKAAEAAQRERDVQLIEADAKLCDCAAHSEGECACGAWCEWKSITSARAVEIIREQKT